MDELKEFSRNLYHTSAVSALETGRQTDPKKYTQTDRSTEKYTDSQTDRESTSQTDIQTDRLKDN